MRKVSSLIWKIGLIFMIAGGVLSLVGVAVGGADHAWRLWMTRTEANEIPVVYYEDIYELDIELSAGQIVIEPGDQFSVRGTTGKGTEICMEMTKPHRLEIRERGGDGLKIMSLFGNASTEAATELIITVPRGWQFQKVDLSLGAGAMQLDGFYVDGELELENGAGEVRLNGKLTGKIGVECGVGQVTLNLEDAEEAYSYEVECGIGDVQIGGTSYSNLGTEAKVMRPGADHFLDIECGVGQVTVVFDGARVE